MSLWRRIANALSGDRLNREIDEEFEAHIEEAIRAGRDPDEARRAFGSVLRQREVSRRVRAAGWLDALRADVIFGWRQIRRNKVTSVVAILSLALAMGACVGAFRLMDALMWRPLPVAHADRLYVLERSVFDPMGKQRKFDSWAYPSFTRMREAVKDDADLIAISYALRTDLTYATDEEMEKASLQFVSGWMFDSFELRPALGRLLRRDDDVKPGAGAVAVLSHNYWTQRFGQDPKVIGRTLRVGNEVFEIVGVCEKGFTGTEPGTMVDVFVPTMMSPSVTRSDASWHRTLTIVRQGVEIEPVRQKLQAASAAFEAERAKAFRGAEKKFIWSLKETLLMEPARSGVSTLQGDYGRALGALGLLVALVLLIACTNVANLMAAQAAARGHEMALRVSIGAGRARLVQMVLIESAMIALMAAGLGALLAWWSAPFVVSMISSRNTPAQLVLPADWRVFGFGLAIVFGVALLFGLLPALRASSVKPVSALKGGDDPHARRRMMYAMIALQVAFCFLVVFDCGLFVRTFERLSNRPLGFTSEGLVLLDSTTKRPRPGVAWDQVAQRLRDVPGVERVSIAGWPLLAGGAWNGFIAPNGKQPGPVFGYFLTTSPGWLETMRIPLLRGRNLRESDTSPGEAVVNESFAKTYFENDDPIGKWFMKGDNRYEIVGLAADAPYRSLREPDLPVAYVPFHSVNGSGVAQPESRATFVVRMSGGNPLAMASVLRQTVSQAQSGIRVSNLRTQDELIRMQTVRERLLAMLAMFFAGVALLLAGIGLYGVLSYSVMQRRREIGIRMAIGAQRSSIAWMVSANIAMMIATGAVAGVGLGIGSSRYIETLFYQVKATDVSMLSLPLLMLMATALVSTIPAILRAVRTEPSEILRSE